MLCSIFIVLFVCVHAAVYGVINDNNNKFIHYGSKISNGLHGLSVVKQNYFLNHIGEWLIVKLKVKRHLHNQLTLRK